MNQVKVSICYIFHITFTLTKSWQATQERYFQLLWNRSRDEGQRGEASHGPIGILKHEQVDTQTAKRARRFWLLFSNEQQMEGSGWNGIKRIQMYKHCFPGL